MNDRYQSGITRRYICNGHDLQIIVSTEKYNSRRLTISLYVGKQLAVQHHFVLFASTDEEYDMRVKRFCEWIYCRSEDDFLRYADADKQMTAMYAYRNLSTVRTPSGKVIWTR